MAIAPLLTCTKGKVRLRRAIQIENTQPPRYGTTLGYNPRMTTRRDDPLSGRTLGLDPRELYRCLVSGHQ